MTITDPTPPHNPNAPAKPQVTFHVGGHAATSKLFEATFNLGEVKSLAENTRSAQQQADSNRARLYASIRRAAQAGCPHVDLSKASGLSPQRIGQVIKGT